jgi:hypothetical protein
MKDRSRYFQWIRCASVASLALLLVSWATATRAHDQSYGIVWADDPASDSYTPSTFYSYNDGGGEISIDRLSTGRYRVTFDDIAKISATGGHVQVTAYGGSSNYCKVVYWSFETVDVACFDSAGDPADSYYTVLFLLPDDHANNYAYAWAQDSSSASYTPDASYAYNAGSPSAITATRLGVGQYTMEWDGFDLIGSGGGHVQVTAYGSGNAHCSVSYWGPATVAVGCFMPDGTPVDSRYTVLYMRPDGDDDGLAFAWASEPASASYTPDGSYSYNAAGGAITATRSGTGAYQMSWSGFEDVGINGGNIQVSGYTVGGADVSCGVGGWGSYTASVYCYDSAGDPVDAYYTILFLKPPKKNWTQEYAFAWANDPTAASYEPQTFYSFNRAGKPIEINRSSVGRYAVTFPSFEYLPGGGNVQVSQYAGGGGYCKIDYWSSNTVYVECFDAAGAASDEYFTILYLKSPPGTTSTSYAWAFSSTAASYDAASDYAFNPTGGAITATRAGVGVYQMEFTGAGALGVDGGHVQVTAYGGTNQRCKVGSWYLDVVTVLCFDSAGAPADSEYTLLYLKPDAEDDALAFAWADDELSASYTPDPFYSFNSGDGPITASRFGVGSYSMDFSGFGLRGIEGGHVQVTAYGGADTRCAVSGWGVEVISVSCHDSAGAPADSLYDVLFIKPVAAPEPGTILMLMSGIAGLRGLAGRRGRVSPR